MNGFLPFIEGVALIVWAVVCGAATITSVLTFCRIDAFVIHRFFKDKATEAGLMARPTVREKVMLGATIVNLVALVGLLVTVKQNPHAAVGHAHHAPVAKSQGGSDPPSTRVLAHHAERLPVLSDATHSTPFVQPTPEKIFVTRTRIVFKPAPPQRAPMSALPSPSTTPSEKPNVSSQNQSGGVNAGTISGSTINQGVGQGRSRFTPQLQMIYARGFQLRTEIDGAATVPQVKKAQTDIDSWYNATSVWIAQYMGLAAQARFATNTNYLSRSFPGLTLPGQEDYRNRIDSNLDSLQQIMSTTVFDP